MAYLNDGVDLLEVAVKEASYPLNFNFKPLSLEGLKDVVELSGKPTIARSNSSRQRNRRNDGNYFQQNPLLLYAEQSSLGLGLGAEKCQKPESTSQG